MTCTNNSNNVTFLRLEKKKKEEKEISFVSFFPSSFRGHFFFLLFFFCPSLLRFVSINFRFLRHLFFLLLLFFFFFFFPCFVSLFIFSTRMSSVTSCVKMNRDRSCSFQKLEKEIKNNKKRFPSFLRFLFFTFPFFLFLAIFYRTVFFKR